jgi:hypothetical protein
MKNRIISLILIVTMLSTILTAAFAATTYTYDVSFTNTTYNAGTTGIDFGRAGGDQWKRGQSFMAVYGGNLTSVIVKVAKADGNPGNIIASLYAADDLIGGSLPGSALATGNATSSAVGSSGFTELEIPLVYNGMVAGEKYVVVLSQATTSGWYGWYCSSNLNQGNWWEKDNPQINQRNYDGDLTSYKVYDNNSVADDSRCGDLWLKARYTAGAITPEPDPDEEPEPGKDPEPDTLTPQDSLKALFDKDVADGGLSYYMDRVLARYGVDPSMRESSGLMTRGRALYTAIKDEGNGNPLLNEFGFGGFMRYIKGENSGYTLSVNGQGAPSFSENTSKRVDYPSHWTSFYKGTSGDNSGLEVTTKRFITENNTAVTVLEIKNATAASKNVSVALNAPNTYADGNELVRSLRIDHRNLNVKASLDGASASEDTLQKVIQIPAGETVSVKAQMGFIDPKDSATAEEYAAFAGYTAEQAFKNHLKTYHEWWGDNIPYMWVSDPTMQKMIAYRWWITRTNTVDAGTTNYPFPTAMEGIFGYNNAIINAVPWQMDEFRYLRSPLLEYGTWADAIFAAKGGIFRDNPAGVWGVKPQHYISKAGWESYKIHGGQLDFLNAVADAGAGDVADTKATFGYDGNYFYDVQYDAWDYDTASLSITCSHRSSMDGAQFKTHFESKECDELKQQRFDTASLTWSNATAVAEMYAAAGNTELAGTYQTLADNIKSANVTNAWDSATNQFLMKMTGTGQFVPFRDINNFYGFMVGMVPQNSGYEQALRVWNDDAQFPTWPMYVSNSADYKTVQSNLHQYEGRSRNYSPGNIAMTLKMYSAAIKDYDTTAIEVDDYAALLKKYTEICFVNNNYNYPDTNEFWNGTPDNPYRSWIHHNFHSQYNTLLIEDVTGITPRDDKIIELNPIDIGLDAFKLSQVNYHGKDIAVILDDSGYKLYVDNTLAAHLSKLCHFTWNAETGAATVLDTSGATVVANNGVADFKTAYDITYDTGRVADVINAVVDYTPGDTVVEKDNLPGQDEIPENDGSYKLVTANDSEFDENFNLDFGDYEGNQYKRAQMFAATGGGEISGVQLMIQNKSATKDVTVELYSVGMDGEPGRSLARTTVSIDKVSKSGMGVVTADLYYNLEKGKKYYIVLGQESGGSGLYCWALSARAYQSGEQAKQVGYDGDLSMYMIDRSGNDDGTRVDDSSLGDCYLEVFYQNPNITTVLNHMKRLVADTSFPADDYDGSSVTNAADSLWLLKYVLGVS